MTSDDIKRLNFYEKQFLGTRDFQDEQAYHIEMRRRHLIAHHIWGIVAGLEITQDIISKIWYVQPGMAIDGFGREIIVFDPEPLNINKIADQLAGAPKPALLKVWIAYQIEKTNRPAPGYEVCGGNGQFMRTHETFRLIYQDDPPFDLQKVSDPSDPDVNNPDSPKTWPHAFQDLPDDPEKARWPIYLGTLTWDTDPNNPSQNAITKVAFEDSRSNKKRHYVGVVAETIEVPNIKVPDNSAPDKFKLLNNTLFIRGRANSRPDPNKFDYNGVLVDIEGKLEVERNLNVLGKAGIGIGTSEPDAKLQVSGGADATLDNGTGHVVIGSVSSKNMVLDDHGIMARNNKDKAELQLQSKGGDLVVHKDQAGSELVVKDSGNVGIGLTNPESQLHLSGGKWDVTNTEGDLKIGDGTYRLKIGVARGGAGAGDVRIRSHGGTNRLILGSGAIDVLTIQNGNVGIGTTTPVSKLEIAGDVVLQSIAAGARRSLPAGGTMIWNDGTWLRLNQNLDYSKPIFGVHTPGVFAPGSLNVGGAGGWGEPGPGNVWITGNVGIGTMTPNAKLDVNGKIERQGHTVFDRGNTIITSMNFEPNPYWEDTSSGDVGGFNLDITTQISGVIIAYMNALVNMSTAGAAIYLGPKIDGAISNGNRGGIRALNAYDPIWVGTSSFNTRIVNAGNHTIQVHANIDNSGAASIAWGSLVVMFFPD